MTLTRKQHIARIADKCEVRSADIGLHVVRYRDCLALYNTLSDRPTYCGITPPDRSQYVIDGMRLAAQRVIDGRASKADLLDKLQRSLEQTGRRRFVGGFDLGKGWSGWTDPAASEPPITLSAIRQIIREEIERSRMFIWRDGIARPVPEHICQSNGVITWMTDSEMRRQGLTPRAK